MATYHPEPVMVQPDPNAGAPASSMPVNQASAANPAPPPQMQPMAQPMSQPVMDPYAQPMGAPGVYQPQPAPMMMAPVQPQPMMVQPNPMMPTAGVMGPVVMNNAYAQCSSSMDPVKINCKECNTECYTKTKTEVHANQYMCMFVMCMM